MRPVFDRAPTRTECVIDALFYREIPDKEEPMRVESVEHVASASTNHVIIPFTNLGSEADLLPRWPRG